MQMRTHSFVRSCARGFVAACGRVRVFVRVCMLASVRVVIEPCEHHIIRCSLQLHRRTQLLEAEVPFITLVARKCGEEGPKRVLKKRLPLALPSYVVLTGSEDLFDSIDERILR